MSHCWVQDNDRLTHCLSIFDVGELAAQVETVVDNDGSCPCSRDCRCGTLDEHKAAAWVLVEVRANEDVAFWSVGLAIITNPYLLHSILSFHDLLNVALG